MKIHHLRNATLVIETKQAVILVDPMLGPKGSMNSFTFFRFKARRNPVVHLPSGSEEILNKVTHCVITHLHPDHIDSAAVEFLIKNSIPVTCSHLDQKDLTKRGLNVVQKINYWVKSDFLGGRIEGIPARHGYGFVARPMGNVMGYYLELPEEESLYITSDTIYTKNVDKVLSEYKPSICVLACGSAQLDLFQPLLMNMADIVRFVQNAPNKVVANHLEALNHCPTTRSELRNTLKSEGLLDKVLIPEDGDSMEFQ